MTTMETSIRKLPLSLRPIVPGEEDQARDKAAWQGTIAQNLWQLGLPLVAASLVLGILGLASPLFIMAVYDQVIGATDERTFAGLVAGVLMAIIGAFLLRRLRQSMVSDFADRFVQHMSLSVFSQLLDVQGRGQGRGSINQNLARLQDLERVRSLFSGTIAVTLAELPVVLVYGICIICLSPAIGCILLALLAAAAVLQIYFSTSQKELFARRQRLGMTQQSVWRQATLLWPLLARADYRERFLFAQEPIQDELALYQRLLARKTASSLVINQIGTAVAALVSLSFGIGEIWAGEITTGMLIAIMMLLWRIMAPAQAIFSVVPQIRMLRRAFSQLESLMKTAIPQANENFPAHEIAFVPQKSDVAVERLSHRFPDMPIPALSALSFRLPAGDVTALVGASGAGKTLLLRLLAGLERPQVGQILVGGTELLHFSDAQIDRFIAYIPPVPLHLPGPLEAILRHAAPEADDQLRQSAMALAFGQDWQKRWPAGMQTESAEITGTPQGSIRLALAEIYLRRPRVLLIDNILDGLDPEAEFACFKIMDQLRSQAAICFVTHNRAHLAFADQVMILQQGQARYIGPVAGIKERIPVGLM